jgi:hypothetical protein
METKFLEGNENIEIEVLSFAPYLLQKRSAGPQANTHL